MLRLFTYLGLAICSVLIWSASNVGVAATPASADPIGAAPRTSVQYLRLLEGSIRTGAADGSLRGAEVGILLGWRAARRALRQERPAAAARALDAMRAALDADIRRPVSPARREQLLVLLDGAARALREQ